MGHDTRKVKTMNKLKDKMAAEAKTTEQIEFERFLLKQRATVDIECYKRELAFKEKSLELTTSSEAIEVLIPTNEKLVSGFKDNVKPRHLIENDITRIKQAISEKEFMLIQMAKEEQNARKTTGDEGTTNN